MSQGKCGLIWPLYRFLKSSVCSSSKLHFLEWLCDKWLKLAITMMDQWNWEAEKHILEEDNFTSLHSLFLVTFYCPTMLQMHFLYLFILALFFYIICVFPPPLMHLFNPLCLILWANKAQCLRLNGPTSVLNQRI